MGGFVGIGNSMDQTHATWRKAVMPFHFHQLRNCGHVPEDIEQVSAQYEPALGLGAEGSDTPHKSFDLEEEWEHEGVEVNWGFGAGNDTETENVDKVEAYLRGKVEVEEQKRPAGLLSALEWSDSVGRQR